MENYQNSILNNYNRISYINKGHNVYLVENLTTHKRYVEKHLSIYNKDVYEFLHNNQIHGIPRVIDLEYDSDTDELIVIEEFVEGVTLQNYFTNISTFSNSAVIDIAIKLCKILVPLHNNSSPIIHRDIKPSNIMITPSGDLYLIDFNAAKFSLEQKESDTTLLGTRGFAAPEQYGFGSSARQTDIYAIGMLMNTMLTGRVTREISQSTPLASIIKKCIEMSPENRYDHIEHLQSALEDVQVRQEKKEKTMQSPAPASIDVSASFLPPGFRQKKLGHMLIAVLGYTFIIALGTSLTDETVSPAMLRIENILFTISMLCVVLVSFNYRGIKTPLPLCKSKYIIVRFLATIFYDIAILFVGIVIAVIIENFIPL